MPKEPVYEGIASTLEDWFEHVNKSIFTPSATFTLVDIESMIITTRHDRLVDGFMYTPNVVANGEILLAKNYKFQYFENLIKFLVDRRSNGKSNYIYNIQRRFSHMITKAINPETFMLQELLQPVTLPSIYILRIGESNTPS